jgi:hypothetical protein
MKPSIVRTMFMGSGRGGDEPVCNDMTKKIVKLTTSLKNTVLKSDCRMRNEERPSKRKQSMLKDSLTLVYPLTTLERGDTEPRHSLGSPSAVDVKRTDIRLTWLESSNHCPLRD